MRHRSGSNQENSDRKHKDQDSGPRNSSKSTENNLKPLITRMLKMY